MPGSFEDDPEIDDTIPSGNHPLDYSEMREGPPPGHMTPQDAFGPREAEVVADAVRILSSLRLKVKVVVMDSASGQELWWHQMSGDYKLGQTVHLDLPLMLVTS